MDEEQVIRPAGFIIERRIVEVVGVLAVGERSLGLGRVLMFQDRVRDASELVAQLEREVGEIGFVERNIDRDDAVRVSATQRSFENWRERAGLRNGTFLALRHV